jgi:hypothetical protein
MANTKKFVTKNGLQSQNVDFVSPNESNTISVSMLDSDTLSITGNSGQLFSITDSLSGTIFAVNDISGVPSIEVFDTGKIQLAETFGNVLLGSSTDNESKLQVTGNISVTGTVDGRDVSVDGAKLDGIAAGAQVNQNAFSNIAVSGQTTVAADSTTDTLTLIAGTNISITTDATNDTITINANDTSVDWSEIQNKPDPVITVTLTGDVTGTANATLTDLASGTVSIATTIAADSVALGTDTTGNYVASLVAGTGISVGAAGEGATPTITNTAPNVTTDITITHNASTVVVNSSDGADGTINAATQSLAGALSSADKTKLDGIASGAEVNQNAFSNVAVSGQTTVAADAKTDTLTLVAGANIVITTDASADSVTIGVSEGAGSNLDADTLDGNHGAFFKNKYEAIVRRAVWSRIARFDVEQLYGSVMVTFRHTRNSVVVGNVLLVSFGHSNHGQLVLLGSHGYSQVQVRLVSVGDGNNVFMEIYDDNVSDGTDDNAYTVTLDNINCAATVYTAFTDGTQASPTILSSLTTVNNEINIDGYKVWHSGNDGAGSGLDADLLDGQNGLYYLDWGNVTNKPDPVITVTLTGDVTGTANTTLTDLANGTVSVATTIAADSVALGTDTTGNYVATIAGTANQITVTGSGSESAAVTISLPQDIATTSNPTFNNLTVSGNLTVNGTTTTVNSTTVTLDDPIITLGGDTDPTTNDSKDRGVEFKWHNGTVATTGFFGFDDSTGKFTFIPDATNASEVFSGTKGTIDANIEWSDVLSKPDPVITVTLSGDVTGTANTMLTDLASGTVSIATTIAANSVALGTDTTGNYVASITNGSYIIGGNGGSESAALTLAVDATSANTASKVVARDASGNFSAGTISAALSGNASTASTWQTTRTLTVGNTGKSVDGSANVSWSLAEIGAAAASHNHTSLTGITSLGFAAEASDSASISTTISGTSTYFDFNLTDDNNNDWWRWRFTPSGSTVYDAMTLKPSANGVADLYASGKLNLGSYFVAGTNVSAGYYQDATNGAYRSIVTSGDSGYYFQSNNGGSATTYIGLSGTYAGRVGIGTTSPSTTLDVFGTTRISADSYGRIEITPTTGDGGTALIRQYTSSPRNGGDLKIQVDASNQGGNLIFATGGSTERVRIDGSGRVGVGLTNPQGLLHVAGAGNRNGGNIAMGDRTDGTTKWAYLTGAHYNGLTESKGIALIGSYADATQNKVVIGGEIYESNPATAIVFHTHTATTHATGGYERMRIDGSGNVGIGTTAPSQKLHVSGTGYATIDFRAPIFYDSDDTNYYVDPNNTSKQLRLTNAGVLGNSSGNARNHFTPVNAGDASMAVGWIAAAFGDTAGQRAVIGQAHGYAYIGAHDANLAAWAPLHIQHSDANATVMIGFAAGTAADTNYRLKVNGAFAATSKSFLIDHPTKPGKQLRYGSLEGPEHGVYVRGKIKGNVIELPDYWTKLVDPDSITVQLTPIGKHQKLYVEDIRDNKIYIANDGLFAGEAHCFYFVQAERSDVAKIIVEE